MISNIEASIKSLFEYTYLSNCKLENIITTPVEVKMLLSLDISTIIDNLKMLITSLLSFKKNCQSDDKSELIQRNEQFESMLQKLESDIRTHIGIQQELQVSIETNQFQTQALEAEREKFLKEIESLQKKLESTNAKFSAFEANQYLEKIEQLEINIQKKNNIIHKLELDFIKLQSQIEKGEREVSRSKSKKRRNGRKIEIMEEIRVEQRKGLARQSRDKTKSCKRIKEGCENKISSLVYNSNLQNVLEQLRNDSKERKWSFN